MPDYTNIPRDSRRVPIATKVQFKFDRFSGFLSEYSSNISPTGMFIVTMTPEPAGRILDLEFRLGDGFEIIKGRGEVVWSRTVPEGPHRPPGMGLRFLELSPGSKELIYRIVDQYVQSGGTPFDLSRAPAAVPAEPVVPMGQPAAAGDDTLLAALPPLDLEPDPFPDLDPDPSRDSSSNVLPWRRPSAFAPVEEPEPVGPPGLEPAGEIFALEEPAALPQAAGEKRAPAPAPPAPRLPAPPLAPPVTSPTTEDLFASYLPKPAPPPDPPMSRTLASLAGSASARQERKVAPWLLVALLVAVVLALAGYTYRDLFSDWLGSGSEDLAALTPPRLRLPQAAPPAASGQPGVGLTSGLAASSAEPEPAPTAPTPVPASATPAVIQEEAEPAAPLPEMVQRKPAPAPPPAAAAGPAVTAVERITWEPAPGGTDVVLWGNGVFQPAGYEQTHLDGPPRELVRILGVRRPFSPSRIPVGTPQVRQVRIGYHDKPGGAELHIVLDLAQPGVRVTRIDHDGQRLRLHLEGR